VAETQPAASERTTRGTATACHPPFDEPFHFAQSAFGTRVAQREPVAMRARDLGARAVHAACLVSPRGSPRDERPRSNPVPDRDCFTGLPPRRPSRYTSLLSKPRTAAPTRTAAPRAMAGAETRPVATKSTVWVRGARSRLPSRSRRALRPTADYDRDLLRVRDHQADRPHRVSYGAPSYRTTTHSPPSAGRSHRTRTRTSGAAAPGPWSSPPLSWCRADSSSLRWTRTPARGSSRARIQIRRRSSAAAPSRRVGAPMHGHVPRGIHHPVGTP